MTKFNSKFDGLILSKAEMKSVKGGECTNFGAFQDCLLSGQPYRLCLAQCSYLE